MHDPLVVAFEVRRPWPSRSSAVKTMPRWEITLRSPFWVLAGRRFYFPPLVTVWHREPGGRDSGEVCKHYRRYETIDGWKTQFLRGWRFHVHHWHIQVPALQALRRRLLTRCAWCGGRSNRRDPVNISHSWDGPRGHWWRGEPGLFHRHCSSVPSAKKQCLCDVPSVLFGEKYGDCMSCGMRRYGDKEPHNLTVLRLYATVPDGQKPSDDVRQQIESIAAQRKEVAG